MTLYIAVFDQNTVDWRSPLVIQIDKQIRFEVTFDPLDREEGYDDDIRLTIHETTAESIRMFAADSTSILLNPDHAERLAEALFVAAKASRSTPRQIHTNGG